LCLTLSLRDALPISAGRQPAAAGPAQPLRRAAPAWRSRTTPDAAGGSGDPRLLLLDQEILELLALCELRRQPARMLAAAGPGFRDRKSARLNSSLVT